MVLSRTGREHQVPQNILFRWLPCKEWLTRDSSSIRELSNTVADDRSVPYKRSLWSKGRNIVVLQEEQLCTWTTVLQNRKHASSHVKSSLPTKYRNDITNDSNMEPEGQPASTQLALLLPYYKGWKVHLRLLEAEGEDHTQKEIQ